jgi:hypothetical protein
MTSHEPLDIHPLNVLLFIMIAIVIIISFAFLILTESDDEKHDDDQSDVDSETVEEIYDEAEKIRNEEDCFGPEATNSLATFNKKEWGGEESESESDDEHESQHIKEYLPDILLLVKMPYNRACDMLERYKSNQIQFYGFYQDTPKRSRSQSL